MSQKNNKEIQVQFYKAAWGSLLTATPSAVGVNYYDTLFYG
jgi:hypothetical protein